MAGTGELLAVGALTSDTYQLHAIVATTVLAQEVTLPKHHFLYISIDVSFRPRTTLRDTDDKKNDSHFGAKHVQQTCRMDDTCSILLREKSMLQSWEGNCGVGGATEALLSQEGKDGGVSGWSESSTGFVKVHIDVALGRRGDRRATAAVCRDEVGIYLGASTISTPKTPSLLYTSSTNAYS